jgi:erythromycin esterase
MNASSSDLKPLCKIIGNARIVMLGEGQHFAAEPLEFRNRLFRYLVEDLGFNAIALESGVTEGRLVHDYVLGSPGEIHAVLSQGLSWTFDLLPQNKELISWMRGYNADPKHLHKLEFFGYDVSGSPTVLQATRNADTALNEAIRYLQSVDTIEADAINARLRSVIP